MAIEMELRLRINQLEAQLKESQELVQRICYWINKTHNITIPQEVIQSKAEEPRNVNHIDPNGSISPKIIYVEDLIPPKNEQFYDESENDPLQDLPSHSPTTPPSPSNNKLGEGRIPFQDSSPQPFIDPPSINLTSIKNEDYSSLCKPCTISLPPLEDQLRARWAKMRAEGFKATKKRYISWSRYPFTPKMEQEAREFLDSDFFKGNPKSVECHLCPRTLQTLKNPKQQYKCHLWAMHRIRVNPSVSIQPIKLYPTEFPIICEMCGKEYRSLPGFKQHEKTHLEKSHLCPICGKSFVRKDGCEIHIAMVHATDTPYECNTCKKCFKHPMILKMHQRSMHGDQELLRKFVCEHCGKRFKFNETLRKHVNYVHLGIRSFPCTLEGCGKSFKTKPSLAYHINTHSNPNAKKRGLNRPKDLILETPKASFNT